MELKIAVYNVEWMKKLFKDGELITTGNEFERSQQLADVVKKMNPDLIGIVEGPDTTKAGTKSASEQLEKWAQFFGLNNHFKGIHGFPSNGIQELCALYRSDKINVKFKPEKDQRKNPFNEEFIVDTSDSLIKEVYKHWRPPLELQVMDLNSKELARVIVAHTKSKGIFENVDIARFEQLSQRNRKKLYAECMSIRERCDQWLSENDNRNVIVMGDINDGAGMDYYEQRFSKSAIEILFGDPWKPELQLKHFLPKPKLNTKGWYPYTSDFKDTLTEYKVNVLIDHILVSRKTKILKGEIWNPYLKENKNNADIQSVKDQLNKGSDHYPVMLNLELNPLN